MVKVIKPVIAGLFLFLVLAPAAFAGEVSFDIRFFDKRIYYTEGGPIYVQATVTNNSPRAFRFKLADERIFSLDFDVRTVTNRAVDAADALVRKRSQNQQVFFREISVESGESFSFVEDIRAYADLSRSGSYVILARIYPDLYRQGGGPAAGSTGTTYMESNRLALNIQPPILPGPDGTVPVVDVETGAALVRERLPPDEVVAYTLTARQKEQWEKYFLYLDLDEMIKRDSYRRREWLANNEEGRRRMIDRYRAELQDRIVDGDISTIPKEFTIERTLYDSQEATVTVLEKFQVGDYTERKRYTYTLNRKDDIWNIVNYSVVNLGTE
ncbi:hypothetical protein AGMMS49928_14110 [Spirochaetia bacterium]|nr:hypothetical protein AGMMS49928_14110 [Spirochaetia bacterium]